MMAKRAHGRHDAFDEGDGESLRREAPNHGDAAFSPRVKPDSHSLSRTTRGLVASVRASGALLLDVGELVELPIGLVKKVQLAEETRSAS